MREAVCSTVCFTVGRRVNFNVCQKICPKNCYQKYHVIYLQMKVAQNLGVMDVTKFSDIIEFDAVVDIKYFPNLWRGVPPMASINTG